MPAIKHAFVSADILFEPLHDPAELLLHMHIRIASMPVCKHAFVSADILFEPLHDLAE